MKVGILGSGNVGLTLGTGFVEAGHEVMIASRNPQKETLKEWTSTANSPNAHAGTFAETAAFANLAIGRYTMGWHPSCA